MDPGRGDPKDSWDLVGFHGGPALRPPFLSFTPQASAQTASGLISSWGKARKMRVVEHFDVPMSDALASIGATEQKSINDGSMSLADIKKKGRSYNWEIRGKKVSGYCNVNGEGKITDFKQGI